MKSERFATTGFFAALFTVLILAAAGPSQAADHCIQKTRWSLWATNVVNAKYDCDIEGKTLVLYDHGRKIPADQGTYEKREGRETISVARGGFIYSISKETAVAAGASPAEYEIRPSIGTGSIPPNKSVNEYVRKTRWSAWGATSTNESYDGAVEGNRLMLVEMGKRAPAPAGTYERVSDGRMIKVGPGGFLHGP